MQQPLTGVAVHPDHEKPAVVAAHLAQRSGESTTSLLGNAVRRLAEDAALQQWLRKHRAKRAARHARPPHTVEDAVLTLGWAMSETNRSPPGPQDSIPANAAGNADLPLCQHYALLCLTSGYRNTRPKSATRVTPAAIAAYGLAARSERIANSQQGAPMPLRKPVTWTVSGRVVQDSNGNFNLSG